jgi:misacylated tRNA(Ala) deacylase
MAEKDYDPRMHTAEHILNSVMDRKYDCDRSFRSHIEHKKSKCDYHFKRPLTIEEITEIQNSVNNIIDLDIQLSEEFVTRSEAEASFYTGKLPPDAGDKIRIVRVGEYDACPCIGPHVRSTSEVGKFYITTADFENEILRIRFKLSD